MGLKEFLQNPFGDDPDTHFYERVGGKVIEVDRQGRPVVPIEAESGDVPVVSEAEYHQLRNKHRGSINPVIPVRMADGRIRLDPNTQRKNVDSIKRE